MNRRIVAIILAVVALLVALASTIVINIAITSYLIKVNNETGLHVVFDHVPSTHTAFAPNDPFMLTIVAKNKTNHEVVAIYYIKENGKEIAAYTHVLEPGQTGNKAHHIRKSEAGSHLYELSVRTRDRDKIIPANSQPISILIQE